ncbi:MAG TPA: hypothetical protein VF601_23875 [Beijerinckiaceae bacterium]|jgi:hypothetical protein
MPHAVDHASPQHAPKVSARSVAISAGLGSAFGNLMLQAMMTFSHHTPAQQFDELLAIFLVAVGVVKFIEPLIHGLQVKMGLSAAHHEPQAGARTIRLAAIAIVVVASLSHGLLHAKIAENPAFAFGLVVSALLIPGGTTYAWIRGARRRVSCAALMGAATAAVAGFGSMFLMLVATGGHLPFGENGAFVKLTLAEAEGVIILGGLPWVVKGLAGGLAIDRRWGAAPTTGISAALIVAALVLAAAKWTIGWEIGRAEIYIAVAVGWSLGLLIMGPIADHLLRPERAQTAAVADPLGEAVRSPSPSP